MTGLDRITEKILSDAKANADRRLAEAKAECDKIDAEYAKRAAELRDSMLSDAEQEISGLVARVKSSAAIEKRNQMLGAKSELVDEAFKMAHDEIVASTGEKRRQLLVDILTSIMQNQQRAEDAERRDYGGDELEDTEAYEVVMNHTDREANGKAVIDAVKVNLSGKGDSVQKLVLSDSTADIDGGVILRYGDVTVNCSLSMIFSRLRESAETEVYKILFKE